jgi:hypothetical protein
MYHKETIAEAGYTQKKRIDSKSVYLWNPSTETAELWVKSPNYAGYTVIIGKAQYEFVASVPNVRYCEEHGIWEEK